MTLQNGIDSVDTLARFVPRSQIVGGATYMSARLEEPGLVVHAGNITRVVVGSPNDAMIEMWRAACAHAGGIDLEAVEGIEHVLWNKFVTVSAFSGATSLMRASVGRSSATLSPVCSLSNCEMRAWLGVRRWPSYAA